MKKLIFTTICLLAATLCMAQSGSFSNIAVSQRTDGSGFVDIYFTLSGPGAAYDLSLEVRFHSDSAYISISEEFLSGSYMSITPGSRSLVWDGLGSFPGTYSTDAKLKLIATETEPCPETIADIDGNIYNTVSVDDRCWMKENLKTTKYRNGTSIEYPGSDNTAWNNDTTGAYAWYDNDIAMKDAYGALYNWPATNNSKGLCPAGWHIPSSDEWTQLVDYIVDQGYPDQWNNPNGAGNALKSCRQVDSPFGGDCNTTEHPRWNAHGTHHGIDIFGLSALPGGNRSWGPYESIGSGGFWWSSTGKIGFYLYNSYGSTDMHSDNFLEVGFSVRCIKSGPIVDLPTVISNPVTNITATTATSGGNVAGDGGAEITARGVVWSTSVSPSLESNDGFTTNGEGTGEFNSELTGLFAQTTYYVRAYGTNSAGTGYGNQLQFTTGEFICETSVLYDIDGNTYNTVQIGDQCWMKENLKTTRYQNGLSIVYPGSDNTVWQNNTTGAFAWHDNDTSWKEKYGALYNGYAVSNVNNICPEGWHAPSDQELTQLTDFINDINVGNILKSCRQINSPLGGDCNTSIHPRWEAHATHYGTDALGFSFLPAGSRGANGSYNNFGTYGYLWSSTQVSSTLGWYRDLGNMKSTVYRNSINKANGHSVRCLKNEPPVSNFSGTPTSGTSPLTVNFTDLSTKIPTSWQWNFGDGYTSAVQNPTHIYNTPGVYTVSLTAINQYGSNTLTQTDYIVAEPLCPSTIMDADSNTYNMIQIGDQCWMRENLKTTKYSNGVSIPNVTDATTWQNLTTGAYAWNQNDIVWRDSYGALYNWFTLNDENGLCPSGWHVPSHDEFTQLEQFICSQLGYSDCSTRFPFDNTTAGWRGTNEGDAMKSCRQMNSPIGSDCNTNEHPRWDADAIHFSEDFFSFSTLPGGYRFEDGGFGYIGSNGIWWMATEQGSTNAWYRRMLSMHGWVDRDVYSKNHGLSVRCIKD